MPRDNQPTRRQKETTAGLLGFVEFVVIVFLLWNVLKIAYELVTHPTLHPRIYQALYELIHYHPTLLKLNWVMLVIAIIGWRVYSNARSRLSNKKRLKSALQTKSEKNLEAPASLAFNLDAAASWQNLISAFPGLPVELDGIRVTHWRLLQNDQSRMQLSMSLTYDRIATGQASAKPDPRVLNCVATVKGRGVSSSILLSFVPEGMLDNRYTPAIIDETKAALKRALDLEIKMNAPMQASLNDPMNDSINAAPMDEFDRAIAAQEKKEALEREKIRMDQDENFRRANAQAAHQSAGNNVAADISAESSAEAAPEVQGGGYAPYTNFDGSTF